ncbi:hypothetical protein DPMN_162062 [Dreissena polymorpha]|uniref:Uncharacterized protein n=1 Tax=Dreissena polymorpha TaxID=45954 RepID=A0A9D4EQT0_DREPO|nr:hypothetical protein DPMN_162062 [Dreissena polymorpha]
MWSHKTRGIVIASSSSAVRRPLFYLIHDDDDDDNNNDDYFIVVVVEVEVEVVVQEFSAGATHQVNVIRESQNKDGSAIDGDTHVVVLGVYCIIFPRKMLNKTRRADIPDGRPTMS